MTTKKDLTDSATHYNALFRGLCWILLATSVLLLIARLAKVEETSYDFLQDYQAARHLLAGSSIYSDDEAVNNHPPFNALLFVPFARLPYQTAILTWSLICIVFYLGTGFIILRELQIRLRQEWSLILIAAALAWYPFQGHIALGQLSLLITICIVGGWSRLRKQKQVSAGFLIGIAGLIKLFPLLLIGLLALRRQWKATIAAITVVTGGFLLTWVLVGKQDFLAYFIEVAPHNGQEYATFPINASIYAAISRIFLDGAWVRPIVHSPFTATLVYLAAAALILLFSAFFVIKTHASPIWHDHSFAVVCVAMLLLSPITWAHAFPILLLPFGLLLRSVFNQPRRSILFLFVSSVILTSLPTVNIGFALVNFFKPDKIPWQAGLLLLYPTLGLIFTAAALWLDFYRNNGRSWT